MTSGLGRSALLAYQARESHIQECECRIRSAAAGAVSVLDTCPIGRSDKATRSHSRGQNDVGPRRHVPQAISGVTLAPFLLLPAVAPRAPAVPHESVLQCLRYRLVTSPRRMPVDHRHRPATPRRPRRIRSKQGSRH